MKRKSCPRCRRLSAHGVHVNGMVKNILTKEGSENQFQQGDKITM